MKLRLLNHEKPLLRLLLCLLLCLQLLPGAQAGCPSGEVPEHSCCLEIQAAGDHQPCAGDSGSSCDRHCAGWSHGGFTPVVAYRVDGTSSPDTLYPQAYPTPIKSWITAPPLRPPCLL
jgi:hypothetical protein